MWELTFQVPVIPFRWDLKILCIKNIGNEIKKKKNYNHNFYKPSLVAPCSNSFLIVKICILIFHGNSSPHTPTNIYIYLRGLYVIARNWENVRFPRDPAYFGYLISFLGEGTRSSMTNHINTRVVDDKVFCFMCLC